MEVLQQHFSRRRHDGLEGERKDAQQQEERRDRQDHQRDVRADAAAAGRGEPRGAEAPRGVRGRGGEQPRQRGPAAQGAAAGAAVGRRQRPPARGGDGVMYVAVAIIVSIVLLVGLIAAIPAMLIVEHGQEERQQGE